MNLHATVTRQGAIRVGPRRETELDDMIFSWGVLGEFRFSFNFIAVTKERNRAKSQPKHMTPLTCASLPFIATTSSPLALAYNYFRYSILPAISLDGVLHLDIMTRSWTSTEFRKYIETLLDNMNPFPQRNSVLVMDNASVHHFEGLRQIVEAR